MTFPSIPGYKIEKALGRGGMAQVYLAEQESVKRKVALKIMSQNLGEDSVWAKRFIQEAQVIAQLSHPNIVPVYDVGTYDGRYFISMEYLKSGSLKDKKREGLHLTQIVKIVAGIAAGLDYAGQKNFVHRDIKPDNIMFRDDGSAVILDFGIVKQVDSGGMTQTGVIVGTSSYMSPEQAQGKSLDQRSDIYSLGILFYELLVGNVPFKGETDVATLLLHINEPVPPLPDDLKVFRPLIERCLAKAPENRYARALEFIDHLYKQEPQIKSAIEAYYRAKASEQTIQKSTLSVDETMVMGGDAQSGVEETTDSSQITASADLTEALSSAKATIRDFSEESRRKKARRGKLTFGLIALVMIAAIGLASYQQLYLVPREREAAKQRIAEEKLRKQQQIEALVSEAAAFSASDLSNFEVTDKRMALLTQVLRIDPDNVEANGALEALAIEYLAAAKQAIAEKDLINAEAYKDYAAALSPGNAEVDVLRRKIRSLRADVMGMELVEQEVDNLKALAKKDIELSDGFSEPAYLKLQHAKRLMPEDKELAVLQTKLIDKSFTYFNKSLGLNHLKAAQVELNWMDRYSNDVARIEDARSNLGRVKNKLTQASHLRNLQNRAAILEKERRNNIVNEELRQIYSEILTVKVKNQSARSGLNRVLAYDASEARLAIDDQDYEYAERKIIQIANTDETFGELAALRAELQSARETQNNVIQLNAQINTLLHSKSSGEAKRKELKQALGAYDDLKRLAPESELTQRSLKQLEEAYIAEISSLLADDQSALAKAYFDDVARRPWPSGRILKLKKEFDKPEEKSKTQRVLPGGF